MKETNDILDKIGRRDGMTVPEGYFDSFISRMSESLPEAAPADILAPEPRRSFWHKVRPYAYMAAMFAGIWCMMKMFGILSGPGPDLTDIRNYPGVMTALNDAAFVDDYIYPGVDQYDLIEELHFGDDDSDEAFTLDEDAFDYSVDFDLNDDSI
ncbi:MAG: hypothetical protein HDS69_04035 [Bacteroidales bacterium]|nr:hypothetical protein [Bacteroidales bacterium]